MPRSPLTFAEVAAAVEAEGLVPRGGFHAEPEDGVPTLAGGCAAASLMLVGNAGPGMWRAFVAAGGADGAPDPIDRWSRRVIGRLARRVEAEALFPFGGPPWLPFLRWAQRAEPVAPSPLGMLIHPDYGLWHAYRGALAFAERIEELPPREQRPRPCDTCEDKPCLSACPVEAFSPRGYDVAACTGWIGADAGRDCLTGGCLARRACPVGTEHVYPPAQAEHHMRAFLAANRRRARGPS